MAPPPCGPTLRASTSGAAMFRTIFFPWSVISDLAGEIRAKDDEPLRFLSIKVDSLSRRS
jgi:hypothetical protein